MSFTIRPATAARFDDVAAVIGPKRPGSQGCWCLAFLVGHGRESTLHADERAEELRSLCRRRAHAPGVLAYDGADVVGWAGVSPWDDVYEFSHGRRYPDLATEGAWVLWCLRVMAGRSGQGVASALIPGAVRYARSKGAARLYAFPIDNGGAKVDRTLASVGVRSMFERAGFGVVGEVAGTRDGMKQIAMSTALATSDPRSPA